MVFVFFATRNFFCTGDLSFLGGGHLLTKWRLDKTLGYMSSQYYYFFEPTSIKHVGVNIKVKEIKIENRKFFNTLGCIVPKG